MNTIRFPPPEILPLDIGKLIEGSLSGLRVILANSETVPSHR